MKVLRIDSSAQGEASVSRALTGRIIETLRQADPGLEVIHEDLGARPLAHLGEDGVAAVVRSRAATAPQRALGALSDRLIEDVHGADLIVIGSPMYNFGISSQLKAWFDHVVRAGRTFRYGQGGPEGLVKGKRAIVVESRGGVYGPGPMADFDHQEPYLRTLLAFIGVTEVSFIHADGLNMGDERRAAGVAAAKARIDELFAPGAALAA